MADGKRMACSDVFLRRRRRVQSMISAAARMTPRTVPRTILAIMVPVGDDAFLPADGVAVTVGGRATVFAAVDTDVLEVESVAVVDDRSVGVDDAAGDLVEDDSSAFWFQVIALGWVGS